MKKLAAIFIILALAAGLPACNLSNLKFDKDEALSRAEGVVDVINTRDYDAVAALFREDLREGITGEDFRSAWDKQLTDAGAFVEYKSRTAVAVRQSGADYIVTVLVCKYENSALTFTISMDPDMNIAGMFMK